MSFHHYLNNMQLLYLEGVQSNFHPDLLKKIGGSMVLAAKDAQHVRIEKDKYLGFIDAQRSLNERYNEARRKWKFHQTAIIKLIEKGETPSKAIYIYLGRFQSKPHTDNMLKSLLSKQMLDDGSVYSSWMVPTIKFRRYWNKGSRIMSDTFGAITTISVLFFTAEDWTKATPEEWNHALNAGEIGILVGNLAGAHADAGKLKTDMNYNASRPTR